MGEHSGVYKFVVEALQSAPIKGIGVILTEKGESMAPAFPDNCVPGSADGNGAHPVLVHDGRLAVASWCLEELLLDARKAMKASINHVVGSQHTVGQNDSVSKGWDGVDFASKALLIVNADNYTAWNWRKKRCIAADDWKWPSELEWNAAILSKHPKSGESWAHRKYVCGRMLGASGEFSAEVCDRELDICLEAALVYPRNYYAWSHLRWISTHSTASWCATAVHRVKGFIQGHVGDGSAWHALWYILSRGAQADGEGTKPWVVYARLLESISESYPSHAAVWHSFKQIMCLPTPEEQSAQVQFEPCDPSKCESYQELKRCTRALLPSSAEREGTSEAVQQHDGCYCCPVHAVLQACRRALVEELQNHELAVRNRLLACELLCFGCMVGSDSSNEEWREGCTRALQIGGDSIPSIHRRSAIGH